MKGGITWFSGEQRGETVIAKRVQRGGGLQNNRTLTANEGDH